MNDWKYTSIVRERPNVIVEKFLPNPYPEPIDDGTWEDDGGRVALPDFQVWRWCAHYSGELIAYCMHPLTYAELQEPIDALRQYRDYLKRAHAGLR
jgi:hypothetical protein